MAGYSVCVVIPLTNIDLSPSPPQSFGYVTDNILIHEVIISFLL